MKCESCNQEKKACSCSKGFTPKVLEIHNPEELILFHKVIIPASLGDEKQTPVTIGKYCNVLMVYEANGHAYLYSSDGIPSKIAFDSGGVLFVSQIPEVTQASVGFLYIDPNGNAAITNDNQTWVTIGGGTNDFNLLNNRPKYAGVEMTGDTDIPSVEDETAARIAGDDALSSRIDSISSSLSAETADRIAADATLQTAINGEKVAREAADTRLQGEITDAVQTLDDEISADMAVLDGKITAEAQARAEADATKVDKVAGKGLSTNDFTNADKDKLDSAIQPDNIDYTVMTDLKMSATASTTSVVMEGDKVNLKEGTPSDFEIPLPVASPTQAGVINTATYQTIQSNANKINAIENGAVAITGIAAAPTQADLTTAWQTATGLSTVINGASILDVDNDKRWTFYQNTLTWYESSTGSTVTVNPFTNTEAGIIKGSNVDGQVHAETDGTGSVQGWDTVKADIANNTSAIATKVDKETNKGLSTNDFTDALKTKLEGIEAGAEVNDPLYSTTGSNTDGAMTQAATTNALDTKVDKVTGKQLSTNDFTDTLKTKLDSVETGAQVNRPIYTGTGQNTDGSMTQKAVTDALDAKQNVLINGSITNSLIQDGAVTGAKLSTGVNSWINNIDRLHVPLAPTSQDTSIPTGADLNTIPYLKVGTYYCAQSSTGNTLVNKPTNASAFVMNVFNVNNTNIDNETTVAWVYRVREITDISGRKWRQRVSSGATPGTFTYGAWMETVQTGVANTISTNMINDKAVTSSKIDWTTMDVRRVLLTPSGTNDSIVIQSAESRIGNFVSIQNTTSTAAKYFVTASCNYIKNSGTLCGLVVRYYNASGTNLGDVTPLAYLETTNWTRWSDSGIVTVPANTTYQVALCGIAYTEGNAKMSIMRSYQGLDARAPWMVIMRVG